jgi:hypothetical protein
MHLHFDVGSLAGADGISIAEKLSALTPHIGHSPGGEEPS